MDIDFINFIKVLITNPAEQEEKFNALISIKYIKQGDHFITAGQFPKNIAFLKQGLFRYYYSNEQGNEFRKGFFLENSILSSYSAILENRSSYFTIEALEDSVLERVNSAALNLLFAEHPCWKDFLIKILSKAYLIKEDREREFLLFDAEQRYQSFQTRYPNLESRIKQHYVAPYLGIAPESLSRIRKKYKSLT